MRRKKLKKREIKNLETWREALRIESPMAAKRICAVLRYYTSGGGTQAQIAREYGISLRSFADLLRRYRVRGLRNQAAWRYTAGRPVTTG